MKQTLWFAAAMSLFAAAVIVVELSPFLSAVCLAAMWGAVREGRLWDADKQ